MTSILVDHDMEGQAKLLWQTVATQGWLALVPLDLVTFAEVGLPVGAPDRHVWRFAQVHGMLLLTNNRNSRGPDSLGITIAQESTPTSLPVLTVGNLARLTDLDYRQRCATRLVEVVLDLQDSLGTGRIFIP